MDDDEIWMIQRDGTPIKVGDMSEDHVRNTLRMLIRNQRRKRRRAMEILHRFVQRGPIRSARGALDDVLDDDTWGD